MEGDVCQEHVPMQKFTATICARCHTVLEDRTTELVRPPRNVRLVKHDGSEVVCGVVYDGVDEEGCHLWRAHPIEPVDPQELSHGAIGLLPGRTSVQFMFESVEEENRAER